MVLASCLVGLIIGSIAFGRRWGWWLRITFAATGCIAASGGRRLDIRLCAIFLVGFIGHIIGTVFDYDRGLLVGGVMGGMVVGLFGPSRRTPNAS